MIQVLLIQKDSGVIVNTDNQTFEIEEFSESTVPYEYEDGVLTANLKGVERDYYKKETDAYEDALKEFGYSE